MLSLFVTFKIGLTILPKTLITNIIEDAPIDTVVWEFTVHNPDADGAPKVTPMTFFISFSRNDIF